MARNHLVFLVNYTHIVSIKQHLQLTYELQNRSDGRIPYTLLHLLLFYAVVVVVVAFCVWLFFFFEIKWKLICGQIVFARASARALFTCKYVAIDFRIVLVDCIWYASIWFSNCKTQSAPIVFLRLSHVIELIVGWTGVEKCADWTMNAFIFRCIMKNWKKLTTISMDTWRSLEQINIKKTHTRIQMFCF